MEHPLDQGQKDVTDGFVHLTASVARALNTRAPCYQLLANTTFVGWPDDRTQSSTYEFETLLLQTLGDAVSIYRAFFALLFCFKLTHL
jgi:hypothetical protein